MELIFSQCLSLSPGLNRAPIRGRCSLNVSTLSLTCQQQIEMHECSIKQTSYNKTLIDKVDTCSYEVLKKYMPFLPSSVGWDSPEILFLVYKVSSRKFRSHSPLDQDRHQSLDPSSTCCVYIWLVNKCNTMYMHLCKYKIAFL